MTNTYNTHTEVKQYLMSIIGNSPFGIITIDFSGHITIINEATVDLLNLKSKLNNYLNKPVLEVVKGIKEFDERINECITEGRKPFDVVEIAHKRKFFTIKGRVVLNGMLITIEDLTIANKAKNKLLVRTKQLEASNKELEQFAYISSHDLQEPLMTVISFSNLIMEKHSDGLDENVLKYLEYISKAADRMSLQIKSLLEYSRIGLSNNKILVDCNLLMKEVQQSLSSIIRKNKAELVIGKLPRIKVYKEEFISLVQNLISNGIKFQKNGYPPEIKIDALEKNGHWEFSIQDNGIGIAKEHKNKIFTIFQRLHSREDYEGTGIGLAQCKKIVELHKGEIWVESESDMGSTFYFTIKK